MKQILLPVFCSFAFVCLAQQQNALLSRFGLGTTLPSQPTGIYTIGSAAAGFRDPYQINPDNPASLGFLEHTAFELGMSVKNSTQLIGAEQYNSTSGYMRQIMLALPTRNPYADQNNPIKHKSIYSTGLTLAPKTQVGYNINALYPHPDNDTVRISTNLQGIGGLNTLSWMHGYRYKQFAVGAAIDFDFGSISKVRENYYDFLPGAYAELTEDILSMRNIGLRGGLMYDFKIKTDKTTPDDPNSTHHLVVGVFGQGNQSLSIDESTFYFRRSIENYVRRDTLRNTLANPNQLTATLPGNFSIGAMYEQPNKLRLAASYRRDFWSAYRNPTENITYGDISVVQFGGEYIPDYNSYNSALRRIRYRGGVVYGTDRYLGTDGSSSIQLSVRAGVGLPFKMPRRQVSLANISVEYGQLSGAVINDRYYKATLGLQLNDDSWFFKRRYE
jgi:long-subunit fatty acid transport protein